MHTTAIEITWTALSAVGCAAHIVALKDALEKARVVRRGLHNGPRKLIARKVVRAEAINLVGQSLLLLVGISALLAPSQPQMWTLRTFVIVGGLMAMQVSWIVRTLLDLRDAKRLIVLYEQERR